MKYIPTLKRKKFKKIVLSDKKIGIILNEFPIATPLVLNQTSKMILNSINGKNSIQEINGIILKKFINADIKRVETDVMNFITLLWNFRIVGWKFDNPYESLLTAKIDDYTIKYMFEEFESVIAEENCYISPYLNKDFDLSRTVLEILSLSNDYMYFEILKGNEMIARIGLKPYPLDKSLELVYLYYDPLRESDFFNIFNKAIERIYIWCMERIGIPLDKHIKASLSVTSITESKLSEKLLERMNFTYAGKLSSEINNYDVLLHTKQFELKSHEHKKGGI
ncbi:MAG: PqqD family peptide modification chaperone [Lachnospiraceae bacterium]|nr:PqqD family peptide modification chaperone [Lachnospiraceae bacterium]